MELYKMQVTEFCRELSKDIPVPGGGSVAALNGALGVSLFAMVANMTVRKQSKKGIETDAAIMKIAEIGEKEADRFNALIEEDSNAFNVVMDAMKNPKNTEEEKAFRKQKIQEAYKGATVPPAEVAKKAYSLLCEYAAVMFEKGDKYALSDVCVGIRCLNTAFWSAVYNVKINLSAIEDEAFVEKALSEIKEAEEKVDSFCESIIGKVSF